MRPSAESSPLESAPRDAAMRIPGGGQAKAKVAAKTADNSFMGSINLSSHLLQSVLTSALQSVGLTSNTTPTSTSSLGASSAAGQSDSSQLSPFAQLMNTLQQLQQSNPAKFSQVTQQIATNLQGAAQTATSSGDTGAANQLNQLATDFSNASSSGQLPNVADLAKAMGGGHHHHHTSSSSDSSSTGDSASTAATSGSSSSSGSSNSSSNSASQALSELFSTFQSSSAQSASTDPMSIIMSTLSNAGVTSATS
jgi:hypothetical protein